MTKLELKLINSYTVLYMAEEITLEDIPETILTSGKSLKLEVELEVARRVTEIVPEPVDNNVLNRLDELKLTQEMQDMVVQELLFEVIPELLMLGGMGGE